MMIIITIVNKLDVIGIIYDGGGSKKHRPPTAAAGRWAGRRYATRKRQTMFLCFYIAFFVAILMNYLHSDVRTAQKWIKRV